MKVLSCACRFIAPKAIAIIKITFFHLFDYLKIKLVYVIPHRCR